MADHHNQAGNGNAAPLTPKQRKSNLPTPGSGNTRILQARQPSSLSNGNVLAKHSGIPTATMPKTPKAPKTQRRGDGNVITPKHHREGASPIKSSNTKNKHKTNESTAGNEATKKTSPKRMPSNSSSPKKSPRKSNANPVVAPRSSSALSPLPSRRLSGSPMPRKKSNNISSSSSSSNTTTNTISKRKSLGVSSSATASTGVLSSLSSSTSSLGSCLFMDNNEEAVKVCVRIRPLVLPESTNNDESSSTNNDSMEQQRAWVAGPSDNTIIKNSTAGTSSTSEEATINGNELYNFDKVFEETSTTQQVYDHVISDIVSSVCTQGRNGTVFTYGQTSTGKTHTMHGIIEAAASDIFGFVKENHAGVLGVDSVGGASANDSNDNDGVTANDCTPVKNNTSLKSAATSSSLTSVRISCMELYNEELRDLLCDSITHADNNSSTNTLSIQEDRRGNVIIPNLIEKKVADVDDLLDVIEMADKNRTVGSTAMNERSSRSHTIFRITYETKIAKETTAPTVSTVVNTIKSSSSTGMECTLEETAIYEEIEDNDDEDKENGVITRVEGCGGSDEKGTKISSQKGSKKVVTTVSTLNLVDLAGSESVRLTNASGIRQKEGGKINQSLLTLSRVLVKLGKKNAGHINYRDSKLTRILKPSLAGNARMGAICCISPAVQYSEESKSTLDFASRTMLVTTNAKTNEMVEYDDALVGEFEKEIDRFKTETAHAEESRRKLAESLREAEDQIVCLMANVELEKSKSSSLEKQNYEYMMQIEELTLRNEELNLEYRTSSKSDVSTENEEKLRNTIKELMARNLALEENLANISDEKSQIEWKLLKEVKKAQKKKDAIKSRLKTMTGRLKVDIIELGSSTPQESGTTPKGRIPSPRGLLSKIQAPKCSTPRCSTPRGFTLLRVEEEGCQATGNSI